MNAFIRAMFYIEENGKERLSLTKTGAAFKNLAVSVGSATAGIAYFMENKTASLVLLVCTVVLTGIGNWIEDAGKRNAIGK